MLSWQTVTPSREPAFMVKGTELSRAKVPGYNSRFMLYEVRTYVWDEVDQCRQADRVYHIRDASTVSDAEVKEGKRPAIAWRGASEKAALAWCAEQA